MASDNGFSEMALNFSTETTLYYTEFCLENYLTVCSEKLYIVFSDEMTFEKLH